MPRVPSIQRRSDVPEAAAHHYDAIASSRGHVSGPFSVLLNSPEVAGRAAHLGSYLRFESCLDPAIRELTVLTAAREHDCHYEWSVHVALARKAGVRDAAIAVVAQRLPLDELTEDERLVIGYGRELLRGKGVSDRSGHGRERRPGEAEEPLLGRTRCARCEPPHDSFLRDDFPKRLD